MTSWLDAGRRSAKLACIAALLLLSCSTAHAAQLRRIWMQDHCAQGICTGINISRDDYVIMTQTPVVKQIMLTFVNSSIAKIPHLMFDSFPDLEILRMENCSVESFEKPQFEGASNLMSLQLGHNLLREVPKNIFLGADNLSTLKLNHNQLRALHNNSFSVLRELRELSLEGNKLEQLPAGLFAPLRKLLDLNLAGNRLSSLPRGLFERNLNMSRLSLAGNLFKAFQMEWLRLQPSMKLLDLSSNELHDLTLNFSQLDRVELANCDMRKLTVYGIVKELELRNNSLRDMPHIPLAVNVSSLDLSQNPLGSMQGNPFRRFTALLRLNLSSCGLHDMPEALFKKQGQLQLLDISSNSLTTLKFILFDSLKSLQYFNFQQNNWNCDFLQLLMNSFVKRKDISFTEDSIEPEVVDDYVDGVACWYDGTNTRSSKKCGNGEAGGAMTDAALELSIVRNDIKALVESIDKKFVKVYRLLEEMKLRL